MSVTHACPRVVRTVKPCRASDPSSPGGCPAPRCAWALRDRGAVRLARWRRLKSVNEVERSPPSATGAAACRPGSLVTARPPSLPSKARTVLIRASRGVPSRGRRAALTAPCSPAALSALSNDVAGVSNGSSGFTVRSRGVVRRRRARERVRAAAARPRTRPGGRADESRTRPRIRRDYPPNLSILVSGGKETNKDSPSNGERKGKSPARSPRVPAARGRFRVWEGRSSRGAAAGPSPS